MITQICGRSEKKTEVANKKVNIINYKHIFLFLFLAF